MIKETSAGIVLYRKENTKNLFLLLHYPSGHWDFVKGKMEKNETTHETAIRETKEETGITIGRKQIIGQLKPVTTLNSGFTILPFVCILDEINELTPNSEVEEFLEIPLVPFLQTLTNDSDPEHNSIQEMYVLTFENNVIWGASARMIKQITEKIASHE